MCGRAVRWWDGEKHKDRAEEGVIQKDLEVKFSTLGFRRR